MPTWPEMMRGETYTAFPNGPHRSWSRGRPVKTVVRASSHPARRDRAPSISMPDHSSHDPIVQSQFQPHLPLLHVGQQQQGSDGTDSQGFRVVFHGHHQAGAAKTGTSAEMQFSRSNLICSLHQRTQVLQRSVSEMGSEKGKEWPIEQMRGLMLDLTTPATEWC